MLRFTLAVVLLACGVPAATVHAQSDQKAFVLKNGRVVTGKPVSDDGKVIKLMTADGKQIQLNKDEVEAVRDAGAQSSPSDLVMPPGASAPRDRTPAAGGSTAPRKRKFSRRRLVRRRLFRRRGRCR